MEQEVLYDQVGSTAVITVNRPEQGNAVSIAVSSGLFDAITRAADDESIRAVIVTGAGDRVFISGGDVKQYDDILHSKEDVYKVMSKMRSVLTKMQQSTKPVIAACNGAVRGGGGEIACAAHFRIAARRTTIGFVQVKLGISPGWGGGVLLQRLVGYRRALKLLLTGEILSADEALGIGLFDEVVDDNQIMDRALAFAEQFSVLSPRSIAGILNLVQTMDENAVALSMERESRLCAELWMTPEHEKAVAEFLRKK